MLSEWSEFFVAAAGACAALGGLIIVAVSVSVTEMIAIPGMASRAGVAVALLALPTVASLAGLIPDISLPVFGVIVTLLGAVVLMLALGSLRILLRNRRLPLPEAAQIGGAVHSSLTETLAKGLPGVLATACVSAGGVLLMFDVAAGVLWLAAGTLVAICAALVAAWVVMVEIRR